MTGQDKTRNGGGPAAGDAKLVDEIREQQNTGNHDKPGEEARGSDRHGGTRAGAENVEPKRR